MKIWKTEFGIKVSTLTVGCLGTGNNDGIFECVKYVYSDTLCGYAELNWISKYFIFKFDLQHLQLPYALYLYNAFQYIKTSVVLILNDIETIKNMSLNLLVKLIPAVTEVYTWTVPITNGHAKFSADQCLYDQQWKMWNIECLIFWHPWQAILPGVPAWTVPVHNEHVYQI